MPAIREPAVVTITADAHAAAVSRLEEVSAYLFDQWKDAEHVVTFDTDPVAKHDAYTRAWAAYDAWEQLTIAVEQIGGAS